MNQVSEDKECPAAAARAIRDDSGTVFLDSGMDSKGTSLLGENPDFVLSGNDWERLDRELTQRRREGNTQGYPEGAAVGFVAFDGTFHFGFYDRLHVFPHGVGRWTNRRTTSQNALRTNRPHRFNSPR